jgi:hypothetical protein
VCRCWRRCCRKDLHAHQLHSEQVPQGVRSYGVWYAAQPVFAEHLLTVALDNYEATIIVESREVPFFHHPTIC